MNLPDRLRSLASQCRKQMPQYLPHTLDIIAREVEDELLKATEEGFKLGYAHAREIDEIEKGDGK